MRAAIRKGLKKLNAAITNEDVTPGRLKQIQIISDVFKKSLPPFDRCVALTEIKSETPGMTSRQLAEMMDMDEALVSKCLCIERLGPEAYEAFKAGSIGLTDMVSVSRLPVDDRLGSSAMKQNGATRDQLADAARKPRKPRREDALREQIEAAHALGHRHHRRGQRPEPRRPAAGIRRPAVGDQEGGEAVSGLPYTSRRTSRPGQGRRLTLAPWRAPRVPARRVGGPWEACARGEPSMTLKKKEWTFAGLLLIPMRGSGAIPPRPLRHRSGPRLPARDRPLVLELGGGDVLPLPEEQSGEGGGQIPRMEGEAGRRDIPDGETRRPLDDLATSTKGNAMFCTNRDVTKHDSILLGIGFSLMLLFMIHCGRIH